LQNNSHDTDDPTQGEMMSGALSDCARLLEWIGAAPNTQPRWENARALISVLDTFRTSIKVSCRCFVDVSRLARDSARRAVLCCLLLLVLWLAVD
jgi:hypothetical protein